LATAYDLSRGPLILDNSVDLGYKNAPLLRKKFQAIGSSLIDAFNVVWIYKWKKGRKHKRMQIKKQHCVPDWIFMGGCRCMGDEKGILPGRGDR
jgi:hypothetical protein